MYSRVDGMDGAAWNRWCICNSVGTDSDKRKYRRNDINAQLPEQIDWSYDAMNVNAQTWRGCDKYTTYG